MPGATPPDSPSVAEVLAKDFPPQAAHMNEILNYLDAGAPASFLARYRRERVGGADEARLLEIRDRRSELADLQVRREETLKKLDAKGVLTDEIRARVMRARTRADLADLFFAHREGVRSADEAAAEERLGPLAAAILGAEANLSLADLSEPFLSAEAGTPDVGSAVDATVAVLCRRIYESAVVRHRIREYYRSAARLRSKLVEGADVQKKYETYHDFNQSVSSVPTHRVLAVLRGARESALEVGIGVNRDKALNAVRSAWKYAKDHPWKHLLDRATEEAYERLLKPAMESDLLRELKDRADRAAVQLFARNLEQLLLAPPAGEVVVMGVDPGVRRGCRISVVNEKGEHQRHASISPFANKEKPEGQKKIEAASKTLGDFCRQFHVSLIAVGSGPGCREVERFLRQTIKGEESIEAKVVLVNDAGLSAYSTSAVARREYPKLDPRVRAATSLARRLQDPLREMVKIEPKSINVGPYQREVDQGLLTRGLTRVIRSCVAKVGVDPNRAGEHLLAKVPGLGQKRARAIVARREEKGPFKNRVEFKEIDGLSDLAWLVAAPYLRITDGDNPLDRTRIHPEAYPVVEGMAEKLGLEPGELVDNERALAGLDPAGFRGEEFSLGTVERLFEDLRAAGADPRGVYEPPAFRDDLSELSDLEVGMVLEGVVTNIASFGAFVDVGIEQEGLVHVSELSDEFVDDPGRVVSVGRRVKVRVLAVDKERRRLSLSCRTPGAKKPRAPQGQKPGGGRGGPPRRGGAPDRGKPQGGGRPGGPGQGRRPPQRAGAKGGKRGSKPGGRPGGDRRGRGGRDDRRGRGGPRKPMIHEQKAKRDKEPDIDPTLPEDEKYRLKLERLRKKFEKGT